MICLKIIAICLLIYIIFKSTEKSEYMTDGERIERSSEILNNKHLFTGSSKLSDAQKKLEWMDSISFYDAFTVLRNNSNASISDLKNIFN